MKITLKEKNNCTLKGWNFQWGTLDAPITAGFVEFILNSLSDPDGPRIDVYLKDDNPDILVINLRLFSAETSENGPKLELRLSELIYDWYGRADKEPEVMKLRAIMSKIIKEIDREWPPESNG